jgi:hypothetical protein
VLPEEDGMVPPLAFVEGVLHPTLRVACDEDVVHAVRVLVAGVEPAVVMLSGAD